MHGSGTSVVAACVRLLGVDFGSEFIPATADHPKGYWESPRFLAINEQILATLGLSWHSLRLPTRAHLTAPSLEPIKQAAVRCIAQTFGRSSPWGFKDPRTGRLLPFWQGVFRAVGCRDAYVIVLRHPSSVARTLARRDGFSPEKSLVLWAEHVLATLVYTRGRPRVVVDYDALLDGPRDQVARVARSLGLSLPDRIDASLAEYVDRSLRHSRFAPEDLPRDAWCAPIVGDLYTACLRLAQGDGPQPAGAPGAALASFWKALFDLTPVLAAADQEGARAQALAARSSSLEATLETVQRSWSWRLTRPLRLVRGLL
jgi:hypothetical protein